ncbi:MAG: polysaccharide deacetylase family protein [Bacteroidota bacterium]|nr:polysaccharide deacetylase family protein [Bacteroidota bacterium]
MIFLSFDIEEFDNLFPCSQNFTFEEQMSVSRAGTALILDLLKQKGVKATFFCTANFALHAKNLILRMVDEGHEVASHGYYHNLFNPGDKKRSKEVLEELTGQEVVGFRMPNMMHVDNQELLDCGFKYNSSLNPTCLPGKYNNLGSPRRIFKEEGICQIPASVSPLFRIPLFWLSLHNFPLALYRLLCDWTVRKDGYINIYFHPWEFMDIKGGKFDLPGIVTRNSGTALAKRLEAIITHFQQKQIPFGCLRDCESLFLNK